MIRSQAAMPLPRTFLPLAVNLAIAAALRLVLPFTLAAGGERHLYYLMSVLLPVRGCPTYQCFRLVPPLVANFFPLQGANAFLAAGLVFQGFAGALLWVIADRLYGSTRVGFLASCWYWVVWGPMPNFWDPLLIADPVTTFWSLAALLLLLDRHYLVALPFLVVGAGVKEAVVCVPMIYTAYVVFARDDERRRRVWLAVLIAAPLATWFLLRRFLIGHFDYISGTDVEYLVHPYTYGLWVRTLSTWPRNLFIAFLYVFSGFGGAWILGVLGLWRAPRRQIALSLAALPPMIFFASYMEPHRAVVSFPYILLIPAAAYVAPLPPPLVGALLVVNALFTIRMSASVWWLPRAPILLVLLLVLVASCIWMAFTRIRSVPAAREEEARSTVPSGWLTAAGVVVLMLLLAVQAGRAILADRAVQLALPPPDTGTIADDDGGTPGLAVAPDGHHLAFVGNNPRGTRQLWVRDLGSSAPSAVAGTEGATAPFWAPNGGAIGFFAGEKLKTVDLATGTVRPLADAPAMHGGTWGSSGVIVFASGFGSGLRQIAAAGGPVSPATTLEDAGGTTHLWPSFLPDGRHFLFTARGARHDDGTVRVGALGSLETRFVLNNPNSVTYAPPGFILCESDGNLWAKPFDTARLIAFDTGIVVARHVLDAPETDRAVFSAGVGTLAFATASAQTASSGAHEQLEWIDRAGHVLGRIGEVDRLSGLDLSSDDSRVVLRRGSTQAISIRDFVRRQEAVVSPDALITSAPAWSPDGGRVAYAGRPRDGGVWHIDVQAAAPTARPTRIAEFGEDTVSLMDWSPDGRTLLYWAPAGEGLDIWALPASGGAAATPLFPGMFRVEHPQFSPDGRWIAYSASDQGRRDVWVEPYPATGDRWRISPDGGDQPRWRGDGRELVYVFDNRFFMAVGIQTTPSFRAGVVTKLFEVRLPLAFGAAFQYAPSRDGSRFLINTIAEPERSAAVAVVLNWLRGAQVPRSPRASS